LIKLKNEHIRLVLPYLKAIIYGSPLFRVDIITKTNAGKLKKHLIHKE